MNRQANMSSTGPLIWLAIGVILSLAAIGFVVYSSFGTWEVRGQFGDSFGIANSLFSGMAFAALIYTIHLQRQELSLQRIELELTRNELQRSATAQEASERALVKQATALETAARLNGLSAVIEHYSIKIKSIGPAAQKLEAEKMQLVYIAQLEALLSETAHA